MGEIVNKINSVGNAPGGFGHLSSGLARVCAYCEVNGMRVAASMVAKTASMGSDSNGGTTSGGEPGFAAGRCPGMHHG